MRAILAEELTGVVGKDVRVSQDGLIGLVLVGELLKQFTSLDQLLVGLDQSILNITSVLVDDRSGIRAEVIDNLKTCLAYPVCPELVRGYFQRSLGRVAGKCRVVVDPRRRGRSYRVAVLGSLLGRWT